MKMFMSWQQVGGSQIQDKADEENQEQPGLATPHIGKGGTQ